MRTPMMSQITLTFPDGNQKKFDKGITSQEVATSIAPSLAKKAISSSVNGQHFDLSWPIEEDAKIAINTIKDTEPALELVRHDLAHIMARAVQEIWPDVKVTIGPVIRDGWYYDFDRKDPFTTDDLILIEKKMKEIINARDPVKTEVWSRQEAIDYYKKNNELLPVKTEVWSRQEAIDYYKKNNEPFKIELIESIPGNEPIRMYWHGYWQDLCRGPHFQHTGQVPADGFKLMHVAGAYWRGDSNREQLQRIYGCAFLNKEQLKSHLNMLEEAAKRDHRKLGREMKLFHMQEEAPGQIFWHPNGWKIYTTLQDYMRRKQELDGYVEVNTPQLVDRKLWEASGHWEKYQENMFIVEVDEEHAREKAVNALKPMNCPCHVQVYNQGLKSYRDLPLRMAEFGSCNRYEPSGALHGVMRVRGFTQDDAHIFCREDQIESETKKFINFLSDVYKDLGFEKFSIKFSDRPEKRSGSDDVWDKAEDALKSATIAAGYDFEINPGEGAFYGPKLEFVLTDAIGRDWQCGTLQVDFVLPDRLDANYVGEDGNKYRPVMLHRACLGSFERFIGILIENFAGRLPFWLAPRQVVVAAIVSDANDYCENVVNALKAKGIRAETDLRNEKINYKVREHSVSKIPVILACGMKEISNNTVSVRRLGEKQTTIEQLDKILEQLTEEAKSPDQQK